MSRSALFSPRFGASLSAECTQFAVILDVVEQMGFVVDNVLPFLLELLVFEDAADVFVHDLVPRMQQGQRLAAAERVLYVRFGQRFQEDTLQIQVQHVGVRAIGTRHIVRHLCTVWDLWSGFRESNQSTAGCTPKSVVSGAGTGVHGGGGVECVGRCGCGVKVVDL